MNDIETKLLKLNELAIFKMSLGSKELFHSNFLEFIWDVNREFFIRIVNLLIKNCGHTGYATYFRCIISVVQSSI